VKKFMASSSHYVSKKMKGANKENKDPKRAKKTKKVSIKEVVNSSDDENEEVLSSYAYYTMFPFDLLTCFKSSNFLRTLTGRQ